MLEKIVQGLCGIAGFAIVFEMLREQVGMTGILIMVIIVLAEEVFKK